MIRWTCPPGLTVERLVILWVHLDWLRAFAEAEGREWPTLQQEVERRRAHHPAPA
jgi:hypothetical protein